MTEQLKIEFLAPKWQADMPTFNEGCIGLRDKLNSASITIVELKLKAQLKVRHFIFASLESKVMRKTMLGKI